MKKLIMPSYVVALLLLLVLGGCEKKSGDAVVVGKDYVAAMKQGEEVKDERATNHEQWIVEVRMLDNSRAISVLADRGQWERLRENDRVKVAYRTGKYTGTIWDAEIK
ncbi:MAG: hypothetical protein DME98_02430 [Verrucomicrobia bacterium]|nr:MAG: hypothetical protein DME98_02430 [Verrucomicrobiota bacterium]